jgi:hypothetical protein
MCGHSVGITVRHGLRILSTPQRASHFKKQGYESMAMVVQLSFMEEKSVVPKFRRLTQSSIITENVVEEISIAPEDAEMVT